MRRLLVHLHMFKNAGTTVDSALETSFGDGFCAYDGARPGHRITPDELREVVVGRPEALALSSHQLRLPLPTVPDVQLMPMVFLREPLDRAHSVWSFERRQRSTSPDALHAKKLSVDGYVRWRLEQARISVISDFQTGILGGDAQDGEVRLGLARERLAACTVVGVVERMEESLLTAEQRLKATFPAIDLAFVSRNVSPARGENAGERVQAFLGLLGPQLASELRRRNARDLDLHALANRELDRRLAAISDRDAALDDFRQRCRAVSSVS